MLLPLHPAIRNLSGRLVAASTEQLTSIEVSGLFTVDPVGKLLLDAHNIEEVKAANARTMHPTSQLIRCQPFMQRELVRIDIGVRVAERRAP